MTEDIINPAKKSPGFDVILSIFSISMLILIKKR